VETRPRAAAEFAGSVARDLPHRTQCCRRRKYPGIDPLDRFYGAGIPPGSAVAKAVLSLAKETEFGKRMINGGRLSVPSTYDTRSRPPITEACAAARGPGASMPDAPLAADAGGSTFLTEAFIRAGTRFTLLEFINGVAVDPPDGVGVIRIGAHDGDLVGARYDAEPGTGLSVAARWLCRRSFPATDSCCAQTPRWRALSASTEVFDHGTVDQFEFCQAR